MLASMTPSFIYKKSSCNAWHTLTFIIKKAHKIKVGSPTSFEFTCPRYSRVETGVTCLLLFVSRATTMRPPFTAFSSIFILLLCIAFYGMVDGKPQGPMALFYPQGPIYPTGSTPYFFGNGWNPFGEGFYNGAWSSYGGSWLNQYWYRERWWYRWEGGNLPYGSPFAFK